MKINQRFIRYLVAGAINTIFGFVVYSILISIKLPIWSSLLTANIVGVAFNFLTTGYFAFKSLRVEEFLRFTITYTVIYLLNWNLINLMVRLDLNPIHAQGILTLPMAIISYFLMVLFVFKSTKKE